MKKLIVTSLLISSFVFLCCTQSDDQVPDQPCCPTLSNFIPITYQDKNGEYLFHSWYDIDSNVRVFSSDGALNIEVMGLSRADYAMYFPSIRFYVEKELEQKVLSADESLNGKQFNKEYYIYLSNSDVDTIDLYAAKDPHPRFNHVGVSKVIYNGKLIYEYTRENNKEEDLIIVK